jgi:hypothetical protein
MQGRYCWWVTWWRSNILFAFIAGTASSIRIACGRFRELAQYLKGRKLHEHSFLPVITPPAS